MTNKEIKLLASLINSVDDSVVDWGVYTEYWDDGINSRDQYGSTENIQLPCPHVYVYATKECHRELPMADYTLHEQNSGLAVLIYSVKNEKSPYVDLGLPSGTLWSDTNEEGFYTFDEAVEKYGSSLPTLEQLKELRDQCK